MKISYNALFIIVYSAESKPEGKDIYAVRLSIAEASSVKKPLRKKSGY
jgi:hypothetical protein